MNCSDFQEELALYFGQEELPAALTAHLRQCSHCRSFQEEMDSLARGLPEDAAFHPDSRSTELLISQVENTLAESAVALPKRGSWLQKFDLAARWQRALPAAAAVALVVAVGWMSYLSGLSTGADQAAQGPVADIFDVLLTDSELEEPGRLTLDALLEDFAAGQHLDIGERLLDDISEEEFEYLNSSFDIGDIL